jgi:hypothetical protein
MQCSAPARCAARQRAIDVLSRHNPPSPIAGLAEADRNSVSDAGAPWRPSRARRGGWQQGGGLGFWCLLLRLVSSKAPLFSTAAAANRPERLDTYVILEYRALSDMSPRKAGSRVAGLGSRVRCEVPGARFEVPAGRPRSRVAGLGSRVGGPGTKRRARMRAGNANPLRVALLQTKELRMAGAGSHLLVRTVIALSRKELGGKKGLFALARFSRIAPGFRAIFQGTKAKDQRPKTKVPGPGSRVAGREARRAVQGQSPKTIVPGRGSRVSGRGSRRAVQRPKTKVQRPKSRVSGRESRGEGRGPTRSGELRSCKCHRAGTG